MRLRSAGSGSLTLAIFLAACAQQAVQTPCAPLSLGESVGFEDVRRLLASCVESGAFPGAVLTVGTRDSVLSTLAVGHYGQDDLRPVDDSTVYDLASLTKVIGLTTAAMLLVSEGRLDLDQRLSGFFPELNGKKNGRITIRQLLTHTSGLPAWRPLHLETESREEAVDSVLAATLENEPGTNYTYSDFGAITLGLVVEHVSGVGLDELVVERIFRPLGMTWTRYLPPRAWRERITPTEDDPWRGHVVRGEVHDENAARLGGVAGHAGLFSTAPDLARFAQWILTTYHASVDSSDMVPIDPTTVRFFVTRQPGPEGSTRALGWDTPSADGSSAGTLLSRRSFGHTGFTGTSIWIDPERDLFIILLTNRVHPTRENSAMGWVRPQVADAVVRAVGGRADGRTGGRADPE
jgi:CubicO group peptidase (beta-lactamase class C family)